MKNIYLLLVLILLSCGGNDDTTVVEPPVAANDTATTIENTSVSIDVLSNDSLKNNATLSDFASISTNNGSISEISNRLIYTPANNFTGTDTFTYSICDALSTPNCGTATVTVTVTDSGNPIAVDDTYDTVENTSTILNTFLDNDNLADGAILTSIDVALTNGTTILNNDGTITYTALNGFSGEDTFTYTICDTDTPASCATASVTITVADEGNPIAVEDAITVLKNQITTINYVLDNDTLTDDAVLTSIDNTSTTGSVVLNTDGTLTYEPNADFEGQDTFTYTICDDDSPTNNCATASVSISVITPVNFSIPSELQDYYDSIIFSEDTSLTFDEIENLTKTKHTTILSYGQRHQYLYNADEDLSNADNVILMYSSESRYWEEYTSGTNAYSPQTFNTEHVYPQSLLTADDAVTDLHHLRSCDATVNSDRLNYPFADGTGTYKLVGETWFPGDEWKGDVARMIMYLNIRYGETFTKVGTIDLFIKWNIEDPVSPFEEQRNSVIYAAQGNRNPFIDNPYLATLIWGGSDAENKWQ